MQIKFWGVRGSYPVPGPNTVRYGGHTSCIETRSDSGDRLIVDAGTGLRELGHQLAKEQQQGGTSHYHILLSHVHWDHIQGLPFFQPAYIDGTKISIYALRSAREELQHVIGRITRQEFFPMPLENIPATFEFHQVTADEPFTIGETTGKTTGDTDDEGDHSGSFAVWPLLLNHPMGAVGYRIHADQNSWAYVSDTAPFSEVLHKQNFLPGLPELTDEDRSTLATLRANLRNGLRGTDTVVYDTHFLPEEYRQFPHWGHSTPDHAIEICAGNDIRRVALYHHAPSHSDTIMDEIDRTYRALGRQVGLSVVTSREQMTLDIGEQENS